MSDDTAKTLVSDTFSQAAKNMADYVDIQLLARMVLEARVMTLRDYFAGQALAGSLVTDWKDAPKGIAIVAYTIADAMLAERTKEPKADA